MNVEILNIKQLNKGSIKYKFDIHLINFKMTIKNFTVFEKDDKSWVNPPSFSYEKDGQTKYFHIIRFDDELHNKFMTELKEEFDKALEKNAPSEPPPF